MNEILIKWKCPLCGYKHRWHCNEINKPLLNEIIWMECDRCHKEVSMTYDDDGQLRWDGDYKKKNGCP
jgi:C4-type Zn-finger protein